MTIRIVNGKKLELTDNNVIGFYKAEITQFGNGAKINCKKEFFDKNYKAWVVICK